MKTSSYRIVAILAFMLLTAQLTMQAQSTPLGIGGPTTVCPNDTY